MTASRMAGAFCARTGLLGIIGVCAVASLWLGTLPGADAGTKGLVKDVLCADNVDERYGISEGGLLVLQGLAGSITVSAWDGPDVAVRLDKRVESVKTRRTWPWQQPGEPFNDESEAQDYCDAIGFSARISEEGLVITGQNPARKSGVICSAEYRIQVPAGTAVVVRTARGSVACEGLDGPVEVLTSQGDIHLSDVAGAVKAETSAGEIHVAYAHGSGPADQLTCRTLDGPIHVALPADAEFNLSVDALSGRFKSDFPVTVASPVGGNCLRAQVGAGGPLVTFDTLDGDITLTAL